MSAVELTREERTERLADLRAREAARKVTLGGVPLMDLPLHRRIAFAIYDPGAIVPRGDNYQEPLHRWQARAIQYVLDEPAPSVELAALRQALRVRDGQLARLRGEMTGGPR